MLIVIEGVDRAGKSTQAARLAEVIPNSIVVSFPDRTTTTGKLINEALTNKASYDPRTLVLLFAANHSEKIREIEMMLSTGKHVIVDRYYFSGIAYGSADGISPAWISKLYDSSPIPDIVFYLQMSDELLKSRFDKLENPEHFERFDIQKRISGHFNRLFENMKAVEIIDAGLPIDEVAEKIKSKFK